MSGYIGVLFIVGLVGFNHVGSTDCDRTEAEVAPEAKRVSGEALPNSDFSGCIDFQRAWVTQPNSSHNGWYRPPSILNG